MLLVRRAAADRSRPLVRGLWELDLLRLRPTVRVWLWKLDLHHV